MEVVSKAIEKGLDLVVELAVRQLGYIVCYKNNLEELNDSVKKLEVARDTVDHKVRDAKWNGKEILPDVKLWKDVVNEKIRENDRFKNDKGHKIGCSMGFLPYLWFRHQLGRKAKKMATGFKSLKTESDNFNVVCCDSDPTTMNAVLSNIDYEEFESRSEIMERINAALKDSSVRMIGVYGPGGVGKTSLVKELAKKAREENLFNVVIMVNITRNPDPSKIQGEIADILGLKFEEASEIGRADRLRKRIRQEEENTLIILDDLWEGLDLNKLGIPFDDIDFSHEAGNYIQNFDYDMIKKEKSSGRSIVKILLTSRNEEVLSAQMDVKTESIFSIGFLKENEANKLFKKVAGVLDKDSKREKLTVEIVKQCGGLPLAIIPVGKALKNKTYTEWNEALEQLKREGTTEVEKSIKLSYDHLKSEELKFTFLLCAQMGPHSLITDLIKYSIGLCILQGVHTIKDADNRIGRLIKNLKDSGLLLDIDSNDYFSMHDVVRDAALSIASKEHNIFTLRNGKLDEWPDKDELERYTTISLHHSDIIDGLPEGLNCPRLKVFHIDNDDSSMRIPDSSMRIPDNFFEGMKKLRVLVLIGFHLSHLPPSINCLTNLRMLCLERCVLGNLSIIGELKKLRILSLSDSDIEILPCELGQLCKLQFFDITNCSKLKVIPPNVLSSLTSLEELYMRNSLNLRQGEGEANNSQIALLDELRHLHQLRTLEICILNAEVYLRDLFFDKLDNYKIVVGDFKMLSAGDFKMPNKYEALRTLALQLEGGIDIHSRIKEIKILFGKVENLLLGEIKGVRNALYELNLEGLPCLKHLSIINSFDIQYIINSVEFIHPQNFFTKLESLFLYKLVNMEILCHCRLTNDSLCNLKTIKIQICSRLKNLFSFQLVKLLTKLETIEVSQCDSLEEIVVGELEGNADRNVEDCTIEFPQLQSLTLLSLPSFIGFYANGAMLPMSQSIQRRAPNVELYEITTEDRHVVTTSHSLFSERVVIPNIESLELSSINIHMIWSYQSLSSFCFQNLMKLNVNNCNKMTYLFSFSIAKNLVSLKDLSVSECEMMEEIFDPQEISEAEVILFPKLEKIHLTRMESLRTIWPQDCSLVSFSNLDSVVIEQCEKLVIIFPRHMIGRIQNIIKLEVVKCKSVKEIFDFKDAQQTNEDGKETNFQDIVINLLPNLEHVWNRDPKGILNFKKVQSIKVQGCPNLKNLLPVSVAKGLQKLKTLGISDCIGMEEIVYREEGSVRTLLGYQN